MNQPTHEKQSGTASKELVSVAGGAILIIRPVDKAEIVPLFCGCCKFPMKTLEDSIAFRRHGVCSHCDNRWTNNRAVSWADGKWPDTTSEEWQEFIETRAFYAKPILNLK